MDLLLIGQEEQVGRGYDQFLYQVNVKEEMGTSYVNLVGKKSDQVRMFFIVTFVTGEHPLTVKAQIASFKLIK